ncbi:MAG: deoxyribonuclease IV [Candidatus Krumholzibacteriia bacterium]
MRRGDLTGRPRPLRPSAAERAGRAPLLGAHVSVAGGMGRGIANARALGCTAMQVFVKNQQQWKGRTLDPPDLEAFRAARDESLVRHSMAHGSYLVNLGTPDGALWRRSRLAIRDEMRRCAALGIPKLVLHPGSHVGTGEARGLRRIASGLRWLLAQPDTQSVSILLESTAGQGSSLGHRFEHLAQLLEDAGDGGRLGVCIDTCHLLAAGYDVRTPRGHAEVFDELDRVVGLDHVRAFHLNDSRKPLGSRVDRHAEIGKGYVGRAFFRRLLRDERFAGLPMVLETPGGQEGYRRNLRLLRRFLHGLVRSSVHMRTSGSVWTRRPSRTCV